MTYEELKKHTAEKVDSAYTRDIYNVLKSLIEIFKKLHFADKSYYRKIVVRCNTDMQKLWPFLELLATNNTTDYWLEYTRYEDSRNQYDVYGLLFGTNAKHYGMELEEPIEIAIKRLLLEHYKPECMPDSDTFLDNYSKHMADNQPPSTFPPVVLWYEFLLKLAQEPGSFIEITPLDGPLKPGDFPYPVVTQTIKNDVCEASIAALEYLLDKAEHSYKQRTDDLREEAGQKASGKVGETKRPKKKLKPLSKGFSFGDGQAFFTGKDLRLPAGEAVDILKKLVTSLGKTVKHTELDSQSSNSNASDFLRGRITTIRTALKKSRVPYKVRSMRGIGYVLEHT